MAAIFAFTQHFRILWQSLADTLIYFLSDLKTIKWRIKRQENRRMDLISDLKKTINQAGCELITKKEDSRKGVYE